MKPSVEYWTQTFPEKQRLAQEADLPRRLAVLTSEAATGWIDIIDQALPLVALETPTRTCDYRPWRKALGELQAPEQPKEAYSERFADADSGLTNFSTDAAKPGWPQDHAHLVDFALRYLEADVMLFRSGYVKRHLLRRLRQASLDANQTERAKALIKRAVTNGSGLEEFREFKRLSVRVGDDGLKEWLEKMADGAFVSADHFWSGYSHVFRPLLGVGKYAPVGWFQCPTDPEKLDVFSLNIVRKTGLPDGNRTKVNAWCVLNHMRLNDR